MADEDPIADIVIPILRELQERTVRLEAAVKRIDHRLGVIDSYSSAFYKEQAFHGREIDELRERMDQLEEPPTDA